MFWEKVKKTLFAEDEDFLDDEDIIEEEEVKKVKPVQPQKTAVKKPVVNKSKPAEPKVVKQPQAPKHGASVDELIKQPIEKMQKIDIDVKETRSTRPKQATKATRTTKHTYRSDRRTSLARNDYEIPEIVSPIFGTTSSQDNKNRPEPEHAKRVTKSSNPHNSDFTDVISPYFGDDEDEDQVVEAKLKASTIITCRHAVLKDEDIEKLSLDEIVDDNENKDDDMIQFSLFGGDQVIKEKEYTQDLKVKDKKDEK